MTGAGGGSETLWIQPDQIIIREGDISRELFVLMSGELAVLIGDRYIARISGQGEVFGELGALTGKPRTATVKARTVSQILLVRHVTPQGLERLPKILDKIDVAVTRRYQIIHNKTLMYKSITSTVRRALLQESLRENLEIRKKNPAGPEIDGGLLRHQVRQRIDERLALFADADDPKLLDRIATDYGVQDVYREKLALRPWLDDTMIARIGAVDNAWRILVESSVVTVATKAERVIEMNEILTAYENMPGIRREMDLIRMEGIVPLKARIETLRTTYFARHLAAMEDEQMHLFHERKIKLSIEGAKADAGGDAVLLVQAARELGIEDEYEAQIRNLVAMSETGTHFVDMSRNLVSATNFTAEPISEKE